MAVDIAEATEDTRSLAQIRATEERLRLKTERELHEKQVAAQTKKRSKDLEEAMEGLDEHEQRLVRLHAAILVETQGYVGSRRQEMLDDKALALAQYMAIGIA